MGGICLWPRVSHAGFAIRGRGASRHCRRRGLAAGERGGLFELPSGVQQPVEAEVRLGEVQAPAPAATHQSGRGADQMADQRTQSMCPGRDGQQFVLHGAQQQPRDLPAGVERLIGPEVPAGRTMQIQIVSAEVKIPGSR